MARKRRYPSVPHPEDDVAAPGYRLHAVAEEGAPRRAPSVVKRRAVGGGKPKRGAPQLYLIIGDRDAAIGDRDAAATETPAAASSSEPERPVRIGGVRSDIVK